MKKSSFKKKYGEQSVLPMEYNYRSENSLITSFNKLFGGENGIFNKKLAATYEAQYTTETKKYNPVQKQVLNPEDLTSENVNMHFCVLNKTIFSKYEKGNSYSRPCVRDCSCLRAEQNSSSQN